MAKTSCFHWRGHRFIPVWGSKISCCPAWPPQKIVLISNTIGVASFHMLRDGVGTTIAGEDTE